MKEPKTGQPFQPFMPLDGTLIPDAILKDPTLSAGARLLWVNVAQYQGKRVECFPSEETLAVSLGVGVRQLQNYINELANYTRGDPPAPCPLLEVKRVWVEKEGKTRNIYNLVRQPSLAVNVRANGTEEGHPADGGDAKSFAHSVRGRHGTPCWYAACKSR